MILRKRQKIANEHDEQEETEEEEENGILMTMMVTLLNPEIGKRYSDEDDGDEDVECCYVSP